MTFAAHREKMGHFITVQNVLVLLGAPLNMRRDEFPWDVPYVPFPFRLEPLTLDSAAAYLFAEIPPDDELKKQRRAGHRRYRQFLRREKKGARYAKSEKQDIEDRAKARAREGGRKPHRVDVIYEKIIALMSCRERIPDTVFRDETYPAQASWDDWGRRYAPPLNMPDAAGDATPVRYGPASAQRAHVLVMLAATRKQAVDALKALSEQGEAQHLGDEKLDAEHSHFDRFLEIYQEYKGILAGHPDFRPARDVAINPNMRRPADANGYIVNERTRDWAKLSMALEPSDLDPKGRDPKVRAALKALEDPRKPSLVGHRLLRVVLPHVNQSVPFTAELRGPAPSDPENQILLTTEENPNGLSPLEWSNALARILDFFERFHVPRSQGRRGQPKRDMARRVRCDFTLEPSSAHQALDRQERSYLSLYLRVRPFFDSGADDIAEDMPGHRDAAGREDRRTAVISAALAEAGELTQGLCSPWQNDYRECSCYYWAAARPDYVNVETSGTGMTSGDNRMQKTRTGQYVPDDYEDPRLIDYDDLFEGWERLLRFQIGGRDAPGEERDPK